MPKKNFSSARLFTEPQRLLLNVILAESGKARLSWERWEALTDWQHQSLDQGSFRLLPLIYRRLSKIAPDLPAIPRLKGLYRRSWYENVRLFQLARPSLEALIQAGYPILLLKGASLSQRYYHDKGARPAADIDLLVPEKQAFTALKLLEDLGWRGTDNDRSADEMLERFHAANLNHPAGGQLDLHRYLHHQNLQENIDLPVWEHAVSFEMEDLQLKALYPADELLHTCLHGAKWSVAPTIRWIVDAGIILQQAGASLDWDYLVSEARRRDVSLSTSKALNLLGLEFELKIPPAVLLELEKGPFAWFEGAEYRQRSSHWGLIPSALYAQPFSYFRKAGRPNGLAWWLGLIRYLFFIIKPPTIWQLIPWLKRRLQKKLGSRRMKKLFERV